MKKRWSHLRGAGFVLLVGATAQAQPPGKSTKVGDSFDALPGVHRVVMPDQDAPSLSIASSMSYGFTEPQSEDDKGHHRIGGSLAVGVAPWSFLAAALRLDYRLDLHGQDSIGGDKGASLDITPLLRGGAEVSPGLHLGGEAKVRVSGGMIDSGGLTAAPEGRFLASYTGLSTWTFAAHAGYRLGQSVNSFNDVDELRRGDRISLGMSEFDALLLGVGVVKEFSETEILGEVTWDAYIGEDAPRAFESPLRFTAGLRHHLSNAWQLQGIFEVLPLGRAESEVGSPLVPIEPRFSAQVGLTYRWGAIKKAPIRTKIHTDVPATKPAPAPSSDTQPTPPAPTGGLRVTLFDESGHPISDATVVVKVQQGEGFVDIVVPLQDKSTYALDGIPPGKARLTISADLLRAEDLAIEITESEILAREVELKKDVSTESQLRGLVRSYSGVGISASIHVEPGSHRMNCDADGEFQLSLPPGHYEVTISAEGYSPQRRTLSVGKEGVTVLNADLQRRSP